MRKIIDAVKYTLLTITFSFLCLLVYSFYSVPDNIYKFSDENINVYDFLTVTYEDEVMQNRSTSKAGQYQVKISLFKAIPVKNSSLTVSDRQYLAISGDIIGLRLFTKGVMIVGVDSIETAEGTFSPGNSAGLVKGDVITSVNGIEIFNSNSLNEIISTSEGRALEIIFTRSSQSYVTHLTPVYSASEQKYKGGLWVRDSAAGIGTMTFYDCDSGTFAALGHGVCDIDTGEILPLSDGDIVSAGITGCTKGVKGKAGELCGVFQSDPIGELYFNTEKGIFGVLESFDKNAQRLPVATKQEVKKGKAQIVSTVDGGGKKFYDIEILKVGEADGNKNMVIKVTDEELIEKTGGIVQGMSGSPIVQNGRLVGAVTHVLVGDPTKGYGIFIENMLSIGLEMQKAS